MLCAVCLSWKGILWRISRWSPGSFVWPATYRKHTDETCSKSIHTNHHHIISKSAHLSQQNIPDPTEYVWHVTDDRLITTMVLKSAKPPVFTINPPSASARRGRVFAAVFVEFVTFDALFLASVHLIQISIDKLQKCNQLRNTQMKTYRLLEAFI